MDGGHGRSGIPARILSVTEPGRRTLQPLAATHRILEGYIDRLAGRANRITIARSYVDEDSLPI